MKLNGIAPGDRFGYVRPKTDLAAKADPMYRSSFLFLLVATACATGPDKRLEAAYQHHLQAVAVYDSLMVGVDTAAQLLGVIDQAMTQMQADTPDTALLARLKAAYDDLARADSAARAWQDRLAEVPGYEHEHAHDHDHAHDHGHDHSSDALSGLPPEQVLTLQQEQARLIADTYAGFRQALAAARSVLQKQP
ncbi:MAG: hypothetical protein OHK0039_09530 [Bacteroidia bacterium]